MRSELTLQARRCLERCRVTFVAGLLVAALALDARPARADNDPWWGRDKALHFGLSAGLGASGYAGSSLVLDQPWQRAVAGGAFSLTLGAGKETWDVMGHGDASWRDFTWDVLGTALGVGVALLVDLALRGPGTAATRAATSPLALRF